LLRESLWHGGSPSSPGALHFSEAGPGEVFTAVVELGVAWEHPESRRGSQIARDLGAGRLDWLRCEAIARGYELVQGWPDGFPTLVARLRQGQSGVCLSPSMALRELGTLGRFFDSRQPDTPLRRLLCSCIGDAAVAAATPVKLGALAHLGGATRADTLSLTQAQSSFAVAKAALSRLVPQSEALVSGRTGRGGSVRFDRARLQAAVAEYKRAMRPASAAALLNVPAFCLSALAEHGLIEAITDPDARRLADVDALYGAASVQACVQALRKVVPNRGGGRWPDPLAHAMARRFSSQAWAKVFKGLLSGRLPLCAMDATRHRLIDQLLVDVEFVRAFLAGSKDLAQRAGVKLTACDAGLLLGAHETYIPKLIEGGLLRGRREGRAWIIDLADLVAFDDDYVLSVELYRTHFYARGFNHSCSPPSLLDTNKFRVWERDDPALRVRPSYEQHLTGGRRAKRRRMQPLPR
uniref:hypothetical protein n=1 Tax=Caulobacter sp. S45 TaxID=1641861 RepID=UPI001C2D604F